MKILLTVMFSLAAAIGLNAQKSADAKEPVHRAKILKIEGQSQQTPEYQVSGPKEKTIRPQHWIEIEVEVEVETTDPSKFIPELKASWFAVVIDKQSKSSVRLQGETTFKNIDTTEGKVFLSAYIEPDTLKRLTGDSRPRSSDIEGYAVTLSGPGIIQRNGHDKGLEKATAKEKERWWVEWKGKSLDGLIVPKSRTPFAPLWTNRYPTEKLSTE